MNEKEIDHIEVIRHKFVTVTQVYFKSPEVKTEEENKAVAISIEDKGG